MGPKVHILQAAAAAAAAIMKKVIYPFWVKKGFYEVAVFVRDCGLLFGGRDKCEWGAK